MVSNYPHKAAGMRRLSTTCRRLPREENETAPDRNISAILISHNPSIGFVEAKRWTARRRRSRHYGIPHRVKQIAAVALGFLCLWAATTALNLHTMNQHVEIRRSMSAMSNSSPKNIATAWRNDRNVVHVIQTRFMQNQPHLAALGEARLQLLQALTIPSMQHQTVNQFLWIIRTDPELDETILRRLIEAVSNVPNAVLVGSNENPEGFRQAACVADITSDTVLAGSLELVRSFHEAAAAHTVLETRCDSDDAVSTDFVELMQESAAAQLHRDWMVWCAENHVEWQYDSPWSNVTTKGALLGLKAGKCITPGLTWGYAVNSSRSGIPVSKHQQIQSRVPTCNTSFRLSKCLVKLGGDLPLALRARTPTSAGMDHILISEHTEDSFPMRQLRKSNWRYSQDALWESLPVLFGVEAADLWRARAHIDERFSEVVRDALEGQCTRGHSCKSGSREVLERLLDATEVNGERP